ncbi:MAG TPA: diguanylate cyclase [Thermoanaerobaculia bacterium]|nr:diguanylate cyclase [Thermoanaerobaculia bacterium]
MSASSSRAVFSLLAFACLLAVPAGGAERGLPLITVFPAEVHKAGPQTFDLAQDSRGILYFGNLHGLLSYDGAWWRLLTLPDDQVALSVGTDIHGRVALGLVNDFGHLTRDASGTQQYRSLLSLLPKEEREFGDVRAVCPVTNGFLFLTENGVLLWNGKTVRVAAKFPPDDMPRGCSCDGKDVVLRGPKGLYRFDAATLQITPAGLTGRVLMAVHRDDGKVIAAVRDTGLFLVDGNSATPYAPAASEWLKGKTVTGGTPLRDGRFVVTTRQNGLAILDANGAVEQVIGADAGLPDAVLNEPRVDREGSLWLAMEGPIVRIDLASPVTVFDARRGLRGGTGDVARHGDTLYAASTHGLFSIDANGMAQRVDGMDEGAWRLLTVDDELLVGTVKGIYRVDRAGRLEHLIENEGSVYDLERSPSDPSRVWTAQGDGIGSIRRVDGGWQHEGLVPGGAQDISTIVERDGVLWAGTVFNGILRIENPRSATPRVRQLGSGEMNVYNFRDRVVFVRATGAVLHLDGAGKFVADPKLGHIKVPRGFFVVGEDPGGAVWINSTPPRVFERQPDGSYPPEGTPLVSVTAADIQNLRLTGDGAVWFASDKGLFRYKRTAAQAAVAPQPAPLIQRVVAGEDQVLFSGVAASEAVRLRHNFGRIRVEFAPVSYRPGVSYQYRLDPIDTEWSAWRDEPFIDYTTLEANDYTFRLRARGPAMQAGPETAWSFTVLPPWYRTSWASALWWLLALAAIFLFIRFRTGSLRRRAEQLQTKVDEKTAELQETVKLLESANTQLEALSLEDDLTGIANRRSFERSLADEWNRARRHEQPLALILLDLDHFKSLNDRLGHPAGDDCLRKVGAFLADTIRRSGEVVARYGGEEFAILLPGVDADVAIRVAETLRDGIERLGVPYGHGNGKRMTASCGVAAMIPNGQITSDSLVASADRALYAAKHSGRNVVRVADETTTGTWLRDVSA